MHRKPVHRKRADRCIAQRTEVASVGSQKGLKKKSAKAVKTTPHINYGTNTHTNHVPAPSLVA